MHIKVGDYQVVDCTITLPLSGPWSATVGVNSSEALTGQVSINVADALDFTGTVKRAGVVGGRSQAWITAGAARMNEQIEGKAYADAPARLVVGDILGAVGEALSDLSDAALLDVKFVHWIRARNPARRELEILLARLGGVWRMMPDGKVWVGVEDWPTSALVDGYTIISEDRTGNRMVLGCDVPTLLPGDMFDGRQVSGIEHKLSGSTLRTTVQFA